jgi:hypothetical protein
MPTLEELLANSNPDQLQALRDSVNTSSQPAPMDLNNPEDLKKLISAAKPESKDDDKKESKEPVKVSVNGKDIKDKEDEDEIPSTPKASPLPLNNTPLAAQPGILGANLPQLPQAPNPIQGPSPASTDEDPRTALLKAQMGFTNNSVQGLQAAQDRADDQRRNANLIQAAVTLGGATAGLKNHAAAPTLDTKPFDEMRKDAEQQVKNYQDLTEKEKDDPNSSYSQSFKTFVKPMLTKLNMDPTLFDNASANQINSTFPMLTKMYDNANSVEANRLKAQELSQDRKAKNAILTQSLQNKQEASSGKADQKTNADQNKALQQTQQLLESARGNPAVGQAETNILNAQKAKSLANLYGDPNKLSPQMAQLVYAEVAKIAQGGAPTHAELEGLNPGALQGKLAGVYQKLSNDPSPANAGNFIKQYTDYADSLAKDSQKVIEDKYGRIITPRKNQLSDQQYQDLQDQYINRFKGGPAPASGGGYPKTVVNAKTGQQATVTNDDDYKDAKAHGFE